MSYSEIRHPLSLKLEQLSFCAMKYEIADDFVTEHVSNLHLPTSITKACLKRKCEFIAGRLCAQKALGANNPKDYIIETKADRSPKWPQDFAGSITHTDSFAAAATCKKADIQSIGIDSEPLIEKKRIETLMRRLLLPEEIRAQAHGEASWQAYHTIIFSAKESIFKCISPITGKFFGFHDAWIRKINWDQGTFQYQLQKCLGPRHPKGKNGEGYFHVDDLVHTAVIERL